MRIIIFFLLTFSNISYANTQLSLIIGKWTCEPYKVDFEVEGLGFDVTHSVEYKSDGTSTDIHTYKMVGQEELIWFKVAYTGPWKVKGNVLVEGLDSTKIIDASIPDLLTSEEVLNAVIAEEDEFISEILELTNTIFATKDRALDESSTCTKI